MTRVSYLSCFFKNISVARIFFFSMLIFFLVYLLLLYFLFVLFKLTKLITPNKTNNSTIKISYIFVKVLPVRCLMAKNCLCWLQMIIMVGRCHIFASHSSLLSCILLVRSGLQVIAGSCHKCHVIFVAFSIHLLGA